MKMPHGKMITMKIMKQTILARFWHCAQLGNAARRCSAQEFAPKRINLSFPLVSAAVLTSMPDLSVRTCRSSFLSTDHRSAEMFRCRLNLRRQSVSRQGKA